jgi:LacI family transcriptional regulator
MTEQLVALGHRRIGFIMGHPDHIAIADRYRGYADGMRGCGLTLDRKLVLQGDNSYLGGVRVARKLLQLPESKRPTAIFAANDEMAAGVLAVAHEMGFSVPEEVSVAGFDDMPLASKVWPALTTIRQPIPAMAARAAELLMMQLRGEEDDQEEHVLESSLTFRQSTGPAPNRLRATAERAKLQRRAKSVASAAS